MLPGKRKSANAIILITATANIDHPIMNRLILKQIVGAKTG